MKKVLLALALSAVPALADGDGADVLPFNSDGGIVSGTVSVYPDGSATIEGQYNGAAFTMLGHATRNSDGSWDFGPVLSDGDALKKKGGNFPTKVHFKGTQEEASDGDDGDDDAGTIDVEPLAGSGLSHGKGSIRLTD